MIDYTITYLATIQIEETDEMPMNTTQRLVKLAKDRIREDRAAAPKGSATRNHTLLLKLPVTRTSVRKLRQANWLTEEDLAEIRQQA